MTTVLDKQILQEIVRVVQAEERVPTVVQVNGQRYVLTYLEDHDRRMQDALANRDPNLLSMLFGQLASKVKYQLFVPQVVKPSKDVRKPEAGPREAKRKKAAAKTPARVRGQRAAKGSQRDKARAKKKAKVASKRATRRAGKKTR